MPDPKTYRKFWLPDLIICLVLVTITTILFRATDMDIRLMRLFFDFTVDGAPHWGLHSRQPWRFLFETGQIPTIALSLAAVVYLAGSVFTSRWRSYRRHALFILLTLGLGPALVVNGLLKDHWARARPRQITEFGGNRQFERILDRGVSGSGKSFPCGHASAAYVFVVFYFLLRRKHKRLAMIALSLSLVWGTTIGVARMCYGAHFPSDVLWAAYLIFLIALILYYFILKIPQREDAPAPPPLTRNQRILITAFSLFSATGIIVLTQMAIPVYSDIQAQTGPAPEGIPLRFEGRIARCNVELVFTNLPENAVEIEGTAHGFGWITKKIHREFLQQDLPDGRTIRMKLIPEGLFTELDMRLQIRIAPERVMGVGLDIQKGEILVAGDPGRLPDTRILLGPGSTIHISPALTNHFSRQPAGNGASQATTWMTQSL